ncbi:MAG TPA: low affinity iron permease family protein [Candidatus Dormibacteraeota bacterium]
MGKSTSHQASAFSRLIDAVTDILGHPAAVATAVALVVAWLAFGPLIGFTDTYQLIINTATSVITFVMVFAIQHTTNRETRAINLKLDELIRVVEGADPRLVGVEERSEEAIKALQQDERAESPPAGQRGDRESG